MNAEQALKIIEDATAQINANRQTHAAIAQAIQVLRAEVANKAVKAKKE
jgi:hypothetical protein